MASTASNLHRDIDGYLVDIGRLYPLARALLVRGHESWSERTITEDEAADAAAHAREDRAAKKINAQRGITALAAAPAPPVLYVLEAVASAERELLACTIAARAARGLAPGVWPEDPAARVAQLVAWLRRSGAPSLAGDDLQRLAHRAAGVRARLHDLVYPEPTSVKLRVPCPRCKRMSIRAYVAADRRASYVACRAAQDCGRRWTWSEWPEFCRLTGIDDVFDAIRDAA